jgi:hypothetical protein
LNCTILLPLRTVIFLNAVSNASSANSHSTGMSLSRPAEPWPCPIKPGLLLRHSCRYPCTQFRRSPLSGSVSIFIFPLQHSLQPRYQFSLSTATAWSTKIKLHRGVVPGVLLSAPLRARSLPPGPPFSSANLDRFLRSRTCTSHDSAASTRREPSTCSPSHQGPADRTLKAGKMLLSLAGRTPRLGKRRPWSRNQAGKGGVGLSLPHTRGGPRPESIVDSGTCERVSHCLHATQKVAPSTSFPFGCGLLLLATSYGHAAEIHPLRGTAPGRDLLDRPTSMLTKHKS